jgi:hypothetical protein
MLSILSMNVHQSQDLLLYVPFLLGQFIYIMKRAGFSMRAGRAPSRWQYIYRNWDILAFRSVLEFIFIYMPIRHFSPDQILGLFHIDISGISVFSFLQNPVSSPVSLLAAGIGSDGMFDWLVDWASRSTKVPTGLKNWLTENVAKTPNGAGDNEH